MAAGYGLAGLTLVWTDVLLWVWLVPVLLGQPVLRLYLLAEHGDCPEVANMFENTRTTFTTRAMRFWPGTCPTMSSTMSGRRYRSTGSPRCTG
jgi:fatty acid desaturase